MYKLPLEDQKLDEADTSLRQHQAGAEINFQVQEKLSNEIGETGLSALENLRSAVGTGGIADVRNTAKQLEREIVRASPKGKGLLKKYADDILSDVLNGDVENVSIVPVWSEEVVKMRIDIASTPSHGLLNRLKTIGMGWRKK